MQQSTRRLVILFSSTLLCAGSLLAAACSSDTTSAGGDMPTVEAGKKDTGSSSGSSGGSDSGDLDSGLAADCSEAPQLRSNTNGFYCSFVPKDAGVDADGGSPSYCHDNETCCNPGKDGNGNFGTSACVYDPNKTGNTACDDADPTWASRTNNSVWECADKNNCASGEVCCLTTAPDAGGNVNIGKSTDKSIPAACNALQAYKAGGTKCATSCAAGSEIQLCSTSDDHCGAGTTCTPFAGLFRDLAYCK